VYEMYPQTWATDETPGGEGAAPSVRPRRRPRRAHSVLPAVLVRHLEAADLRRPEH